MTRSVQQSAAPRALAACLTFAGRASLLLAFGATALGALLGPQIEWAGLWGALTDFAAPTAAQARAEGWAALSERV